MIPNLKTDIIEFGKSMLQIACILLVFLAIVFFIVISIGPVQEPGLEELEETSVVSEVIYP